MRVNVYDYYEIGTIRAIHMMTKQEVIMKALKAILIGAVLMSMAGFAMAQAAASGTLIVEGTVAAVNTIQAQVNWGSTINGLDFTTEGLHSTNIATITEISNSGTGYIITVSSANAVADGVAAPRFKGVAKGDIVGYDVTYDGGAALTFTAGSATKSFGTRTTRTGKSSVVSVSYTVPATFLAADTYRDTMTFSIAAQ